MIHWTYTSKFEVGAYILLIIGALGDHLSTNFALARDNIKEANPFALSLMEKDMWVQTDLIMIIVSVITTYLIIRTIKNPFAKYMLIYPSFAGLFRLAVTIWNISLLL